MPEQLKVTGFDGTTQIQLYHPELSTIVQPISDIAELLVEVLKARIKQPTEPLKQMQYKLPVTFYSATRLLDQTKTGAQQVSWAPF